MSPTVFRHRGCRFYFFSREERRLHVHVYTAEGEAKYWIEPEITLAQSVGLADTVVRELQRVVEEREDEIREAWARHFGG